MFPLIYVKLKKTNNNYRLYVFIISLYSLNGIILMNSKDIYEESVEVIDLLRFNTSTLKSDASLYI